MPTPAAAGAVTVLPLPAQGGTAAQMDNLYTQVQLAADEGTAFFDLELTAGSFLRHNRTLAPAAAAMLRRQGECQLPPPCLAMPPRPAPPHKRPPSRRAIATHAWFCCALAWALCAAGG